MSRRPIRFALLSLAVLVLAAAAWGAVWWARYPKAPDVTKADPKEAMAFLGTDDFNRLTESHRKRYVLAIAERMREKDFPDLIAMMTSAATDPSARKAAENVNKLKDREEGGGAFMRVFLDKFFELPKDQRDQYLLMWALAEKLGRRPDGSPATRPTTGPAGDRPKRDPNRIPSPEQMEKGMANFLGHQPPRTAAQMSELMNEMRKKREGLGIR